MHIFWKDKLLHRGATMKKKLILVKEIVAQIKRTGEIEGSIKIPFPIKEIHKICHVPQPVRTIVGQRCIAYFGEIKFSIYYIHGEDSSLRLIEDILSYKGFASFEEQAFTNNKPIVEIKTVVLDSFAEKQQDLIKITGYISTELRLTKSREISLGKLKSLMTETDDCEFPKEESHEIPSFQSTEYSEFTQEINPDIILEVTSNHTPHTSTEAFTHVYPGSNSNVILTLEE